MMRVRVHGPTVRGRLRVDRGLLVLTALVVALAAALLTAVWPMTVRTADRAMAQSVRDAGPGASVRATLPQWLGDVERSRDPDAVDRFALDVKFTHNQIPDRLASLVSLNVASFVTTTLSVAGPGPTRNVRLVYAESSTGPPAVTWVDGSAPKSSAGPGEDRIVVTQGDPPWPVQVGLSDRAAAALDVRPGARMTLEGEYGQTVAARVSGIYTADDPEDPAWSVARELLSPAVRVSDGALLISAAALVSPAALPDLRVAVPPDQLIQQIAYLPDPDEVRWEQASALRRDVVELRTRPSADRGLVEWHSALDTVLLDASNQIASTRGRAQVSLVGLIATMALTVVLAALLLARRRAGPLALARERGATLTSIGAELGIESALVAVSGAAVGVAVTTALLGSASVRWLLPAVVVAALAAPVLGTVEAARATRARRLPANRAARRVAARRRQVRRVVLEVGVLGIAVLTFLALDQRGPVAGDLVPASTPTVWALVGALVLIRLFPPLVRRVLRRTGRSAGRLPFLVAAQVAAGGLRALPLLVVVMAVAQLTFAGTLAATQQRGQESAARFAVGGDARLKSVPALEVLDRAAQVSDASGVHAAVAARVADGTLVSSVSTGASVRLVVVDARAYERLLRVSDLPDAPQLERLTATGAEGAPVPALLLGGPAGLENGLHLQWGDVDVALDVVGEAPQVGDTTDPVVVVDSAAFTAAGADADPDVIWAVGPGAPDAIRSAAEADPADTVETYDDVLAGLRDAPLSAGLVRLAVAAALVLALLAGLGVVLGAAIDAPGRATALGRLRSLGLADRELRRVLAGELLVPVLAGVLTGLLVGLVTAWATFDLLGLESVTGQSEAPEIVVPLWTGLAALALLLVALVLAVHQSNRLRRTNLAQLIRSGDAR